MPAGYVDDVLPIGVTFIGGAWDEPDLIGFAFDFEQATHVRVPPPFLPTIGVRLAAADLAPRCTPRPARRSCGGRFAL